MLELKTIRQTAATGILPEYRIRLMVAAGSGTDSWSMSPRLRNSLIA